MRNFRNLLFVFSLILISAGLLVTASAASDNLYLPLIYNCAPTPLNTATPTSTPTISLPPTITPTPTFTPTPFILIKITDIRYNPPGDDLLGEFVLIENQGNVSVLMTNWMLKDKDRNMYRFPAFKLRPGIGVKVWSKQGTDTNMSLYWNSLIAIWNNNGGDCATLLNADQLVDQYCY